MLTWAIGGLAALLAGYILGTLFEYWYYLNKPHYAIKRYAKLHADRIDKEWEYINQ